MCPLPNRSVEMPIVYEILADDARLPYYGSAMTTLAERRRTHKNKYKDWKEGKVRRCASFDLFDAVGFHACEFRVIEELPDDCSREQLLWRERWWIENHACVNRLIPIRTKDEIAEYNRIFRIEHRDEKLEYNRKYNAVHRDERAEKDRKYYAEHRDEKLERDRKYYAEHRDEKLERMRQYRARKKAEKLNQIHGSAPETTL